MPNHTTPFPGTGGTAGLLNPNQDDPRRPDGPNRPESAYDRDDRDRTGDRTDAAHRDMRPVDTGIAESRPDSRPDSTLSDDSRPGAYDRDESVALLDAEATTRFSDRWEQAQRSFVDDPRTSVEQADQLVADLVRELATQFATERARLEDQWSRGEDISTETLRVTLQRYRSFFNRLLKV